MDYILCSQCSVIDHPVIHVVQSDSCISTLVDIFSLIVALGTFVVTFLAIHYAIKEYKLHCKQNKADTLHKYNERYSTDKSIKKVIEYITSINDNEDIPSDKIPTIYEKEMFMRFFEELEYAIESEALDTKLAQDMFSFYALKAAEMGVQFVEDYNKSNWNTFRVFISRMKKFGKKRF